MPSSSGRSRTASRSGHALKWTDVVASEKPNSPTDWYAHSAVNGASGARRRANAPRVYESVACASRCSGRSASAQKRGRDRRRYQVERSSTNSRIRRRGRSGVEPLERGRHLLPSCL